MIERNEILGTTAWKHHFNHRRVGIPKVCVHNFCWQCYT